MNKHIPWQLIISRLKDEQDERGEKLFEEWLQGEGNAHLYQELEGLWREIREEASSYTPDTAFHLSLPIKESATRLDLLEEVITLVIYQDKRGEVLYLDLPDRFHTQFRIFHALDALDIVLSQDSRRATDRS